MRERQTASAAPLSLYPFKRFVKRRPRMMLHKDMIAETRLATEPKVTSPWLSRMPGIARYAMFAFKRTADCKISAESSFESVINSRVDSRWWSRQSSYLQARLHVTWMQHFSTGGLHIVCLRLRVAWMELDRVLNWRLGWKLKAVFFLTCGRFGRLHGLRKSHYSYNISRFLKKIVRLRQNIEGVKNKPNIDHSLAFTKMSYMFLKIVYLETHLRRQPHTPAPSFQDLVTNKSARRQGITKEVTFKSVRNYKKAF